MTCPLERNEIYARKSAQKQLYQPGNRLWPGAEKQKIYAKMLDLFLQSEEFAQLEQTLEAGDVERSGDLAHDVTGVPGNLALDALFDVSTTLMGQLREGVIDEPAVHDFFATLKITQRYVEEEVVALQAEG